MKCETTIGKPGFPKFGSGWEKYVGPWYVYQDNWQYAIHRGDDGYRLSGELFGTLAAAKAEVLRRIASAKYPPGNVEC